MQSLKDAILRLEPKIDLLHDLLGFGRYAEITVTSDDYFLSNNKEASLPSFSFLQ